MADLGTEKDSPNKRLTEHFLEQFGADEQMTSIGIPWRDYCELRGIPAAVMGTPEWVAHREKRRKDKDRLNKWWRVRKIPLQLAPDGTGWGLVLHFKDDMAHAEITRVVCNKVRDMGYAATRFEELSQAEGLSKEVPASLQKTREKFVQARMLLSKAVNELGLPEPIRKRLVNRLIPPGKWPWESEDDYVSTFEFGAEESKPSGLSISNRR